MPGYYIFRHLGTKTLGLFTAFVKRCGWNSSRRFYRASALVRAVLLYYFKQSKSLDAFVAYLRDNHRAAKACGFGQYIPSRSTLSRFLQTVGYHPFEKLFYELLVNLQAKGIGIGKHLAIDSTHVKAWSTRKSKDKTKPEYKEAKNCSFARLGRTPKGFDICYRVHIATETQSELPIAIKVYPGNIHDRKAFAEIFAEAMQHTSGKPLVISADKGYSSGKNRTLVDGINAMCISRPAKTDLMRKSLQDFLPHGLKEDQYWKLYTRRLAVERTFGRTKGYFGLYRPRVTGFTAVTQHVVLSFICHLLAAEVSKSLNLSKINYSMFV